MKIKVIYIKWIKFLSFFLIGSKWKKLFIQRFTPVKFSIDVRMKGQMDWENPVTFCQKIQWQKLFLREPLFVKCADKYAVRDYLREKGLEGLLVTLYGVWDSADDIDWDALPEKFVLKPTHSSGHCFFVKNKHKADFFQIKKKMNKKLALPFGVNHGEFHYCPIERKVVAEQYLEDSSGELLEFKIYCFHGKPCFVQADSDRAHPTRPHTRNHYSPSWENLRFSRVGLPLSEKEVTRPDNLEEMIHAAEILSHDFSQVRVDFYSVDGRLYFGELTFTSGAGFMPLSPEKYNLLLGSLWDLSKIPSEKIRKKPCLSPEYYLK